MATNQTLQALLELETEIKRLSKKSAVSATIKTHSMSELKDAAKQLGTHAFAPFEINDLNVYHFKYYIKETESSITVKHTEEYRIKKELVAVS